MEPSSIPDPTRQTPFAQVFKLFVILGTVMIAEHRSYPVGIANEYGGEIAVHDDVQGKDS